MSRKNIKSMKIATCFSLTLPSPPSARESRRKQGEELACIPKKTRPQFLRSDHTQIRNQRCHTKEMEIVLELYAEYYSVSVKSHPEPFDVFLSVLEPEGSVPWL